MKIFKDIFTGDEIFSDIYKFKLVDEVIYEVYGSLTTPKEVQMIEGANPSAEEDAEESDAIVQSYVDVVLNHRLEEFFIFDNKKSYTSYLKDFMKTVIARLKEKSPDQVDVFKTNMDKVMKDISSRFNNFQFFTGESMNMDGLVGLMEYRMIDDKSVPVFMFFKHGLEEVIV